MTLDMRKKFVKDLIRELYKGWPDNVDSEEILLLIDDILRYLDDDDDDNYETNQGVIGIQELFRGYIVKVWFRTNFGGTKYHKINMITVQICIKYYYQYWIDRNKAYHNEILQKKRIIK